MVVHHLFHFAAAAAERFHHDADERFRAIHDQQFERLDAAAVFGAHHDFRLADHQLVAFAAHRLDQDRELQFAAAEHAKRIGGPGVFHAQRTLVSSSFSRRARRSREVTYCPSRPANGEVLIVNTMVSVGSSIKSGSSGAGFARSVMLSPI